MRARAVSIFFALALFACGGFDTPTIYEPITDPAQLYVDLKLNERAINLATAAPYNTIQLTATPRNGLGEPMTGLPAPTFRSTQPLRVRVSHDGLVEALQTGTGILVIAELAVEGNVRHADTARVNVIVNATPPVLGGFEIDPVPPDSAVWPMIPAVNYGLHQFLLISAGVSTNPGLTARAVDPAGNPITGLQIEVQSLDPAVASWNADVEFVSVFRLGPARMVARTFAYGVTRADTVTFAVKLPMYQTVELRAAGSIAGAVTPSEVPVRTGGWVFWQNMSGQPMDVTFDDATNIREATTICDALESAFAPFVVQVYGSTEFPCDAGNIPAFSDTAAFNQLNFRVRQFPVPGVYPYHNTLTGASGRIIVTGG
jgi:hypothetical protein